MDYFNRYSATVSQYKALADWDGVTRTEFFCRIELRETFEEEAKAKARFIQDRFGDQFKVTLTGHVEYGKSVEL